MTSRSEIALIAALMASTAPIFHAPADVAAMLKNREGLRGALYRWELQRIAEDVKVRPQSVDSGIAGRATIGPVVPVQRLGQPSEDRPFQTMLRIVRVPDSMEVARFETAADGSFRVALDPGDYEIGPLREASERFQRTEDQSVTVVAHRFEQVTVAFYSGLR